MNSSNFSESPVASRAKPSVEESTTRAPKISASFKIAVRLANGARTRSSVISRLTAGESVRSEACSTFTSLFICLITCERSCGSISTTMVIRDSVGSRVRATVRLSMLYPRALKTPVIRISEPGLFSTSSEISCSMVPASHFHRLRSAQDHFIDRAARRHHWVDVLKRRHAYIQQVRAGLTHRFFQRRHKL